METKVCNWEKILEISEYYLRSFLTPKQASDNFIVEGCTHEFMEFAYDQLENSPSSIIAINVKFDVEKISADLETAYNKYSEKEQKNILTIEYFINLVLLKILPRTKIQTKLTQEDVQKNLLTIREAEDIGSLFDVEMEKDTQLIFKNIMENRFEKEKHELNIFLYGKQDIIFQNIINSFIFSRSPYSVKIFSDQEALSTYAEPSGEFIQCPHDYLSVKEKDMYVQNENFERKI